MMPPGHRLPPRPVPDELWKPLQERFDQCMWLHDRTNWLAYLAFIGSAFDILCMPRWDSRVSTQLVAPLWLAYALTNLATLIVGRRTLRQMDKLQRQYHLGEGP